MKKAFLTIWFILLPISEAMIVIALIAFNIWFSFQPILLIIFNAAFLLQIVLSLVYYCNTRKMKSVVSKSESLLDYLIFIFTVIATNFGIIQISGLEYSTFHKHE